jgi:hypothetical protein
MNTLLQRRALIAFALVFLTALTTHLSTKHGRGSPEPSKIENEDAAKDR